MLLGKTILHTTIQPTFKKQKIETELLIDFLFEKCKPNKLMMQPFFITHQLAINAISNGKDLFSINISTLFKLLQYYAKTSMLQLASNTQGVEARIKDITLWKSTGKSEYNVTNIGYIRSVILNNVSKNTRADPEYLACKKKKNNNRDYLPGKHFNKNILLHAYNFYPEDDPNEQEEFDYCKSLMSKVHYFSGCHIQKAVDEFKNSQVRTNQNVFLTNNDPIIWMPILEGKVQFGRATNRYVPLYKAECIW